MSAPWKGELLTDARGWEIMDSARRCVADAHNPEGARALVHRANAYDALVEALERAEFALRWAKTNGRISYEVRTNMNGEYCDAVDRFNATMVEIRAALALASPEKTEGER